MREPFLYDLSQVSMKIREEEAPREIQRHLKKSQVRISWRQIKDITKKTPSMIYGISLDGLIQATYMSKEEVEALIIQVVSSCLRYTEETPLRLLPNL